MKDKKFLYITLILCFSGLTIFYLLPFLEGITDTLITEHKISLGKYVRLFENSSFQLAVRNTSIFTLVSVLLINIYSFSVALLLWKGRSKWSLVGLILPYVVPVVSTVSSWMFLMNRISSQLLYSEYSIIVVIIIYIWKYSGFHILVYYSGIRSIANSHFEAAVIDGASISQIIKHIVIPESRSFAVFNLIFSILHSFKMFRDIYILFGNYPPENVYLIQHFIQNNYTALNYDYVLCAGYVFAGVVLIVFIPLFMRERKDERYYET